MSSDFNSSYFFFFLPSRWYCDSSSSSFLFLILFLHTKCILNVFNSVMSGHHYGTFQMFFALILCWLFYFYHVSGMVSGLKSCKVANLALVLNAFCIWFWLFCYDSCKNRVKVRLIVILISVYNLVMLKN